MFMLNRVLVLAAVSTVFIHCSDDTKPASDGRPPDARVDGARDQGATGDTGIKPDTAIADQGVSPDGAQTLQLGSLLSGGQEVPGVDTSANGTATVAISAAQTQLTVTLNVSGLTGITAAHIHAGAPGTNGPVIFALASAAFTSPLSKTLSAGDLTPQPASGVSTFADAIQAIMSGKTYVNVHTSAHPGGEIRGHLGSAKLSSTLTGNQEVPAPVTTSAGGTATVELSGAQDEIKVTLNVSGLSGITAAHIHFGDLGEYGPVLFALASASFTSPLVKTLKAADLSSSSDEGVNTFGDAVNAILSGKTLINVHTTANPGGEIRGQVGPAVLNATLSGGQEAPTPTTSSGSGSGSVMIDGAQSELTITLSASNLSGVTAAHIHIGSLGVAGPVVVPLASASFSGPITKAVRSSEMSAQAFSDLLKALLSGGTYFNVHTTANPGGELRGQIGPVTLKSALAGSGEVPPVTSSASGTAVVNVLGAQSEIYVTLNVGGLTGITAAHIHVGAPGVNGPVIFPLATASFTSPLQVGLASADLTPQQAQGVSTITDAVNAMLSGKTYVNVHTTAHPGGELRGPVVPY